MRTKISGSQLVSNIDLPGLGDMGIPSGATADRSPTPKPGDFRFNTTLNAPEMFYKGIWNSLDPSGLALNNGMPAYVESTGGILISADSVLYAYQLGVASRNAYLNTNGSFASNTLGYRVPRNALIRNVLAQCAVSAPSIAQFQIRINKSTTARVSYSVPQNGLYLTTPTSVQLNAGDEIAIYLSATSNITDPTILLEISWRN